jgi:phosphoribosylanthranilate isomerase
MIWIKICGTTNIHDAQLAVEAGANAIGFIFATSPRATDVDIARGIIREVASKAETIGVFVNQTPCAVAEVAQQTGLSGVQLHGDEVPDSLPNFRAALGQRKIIKVLHADELLSNAHKLDSYLAARESLDAILLDSGSPQQPGGTGAAYDWNSVLPVAQRIRSTLPLIIAGGLRPENIARAIGLFEPWGVDVVSGVEDRPGHKDETKVHAFIAGARQMPNSVRQRA